MASPRKALGALITALALALTTGGVIVAASDSNPEGINDAALALHGEAPRTGSFNITIDTGQQYQVTGTLNINFRKNQMAGTLNVATIFSTTHIGIIFAEKHLYLGLPSLKSLVHAPWVSVPVPNAPELFGLSIDLANPRVDILRIMQTMGSVVTTKNGPLTTYTVVRHTHLQIPIKTGINFGTSTTLTVSYTAASAGQLAAAMISVDSGKIHVTVHLTTTAYNAPVNTSPPPAGQVHDLTKALRRLIFGTANPSPISQLLTPAGIASLGQIRVS